MDYEQGKLFVGGISWETSEETLKDHFQKYGEVVESVVMRDRNTRTTRGFGFVLFSDPSSADKALQEKHLILGRTVEVKKAVPRGEHHQQHQHQQQSKGLNKNGSSSSGSNTNGTGNQFKTKKIFVGGLSSSLTEEAFKGYFEKFGRITDVVVMYDSVTQRPRGFGFITFDSEEAVENVMQNNFHELNGKHVEVKRAVPKDGSNGNNNSGYNMRMGNGRGSVFGRYHGGFYPPYSPRYGFFNGYMPLPVSGYGSAGGYPYGMYPMGGYSGVGYSSPIMTPRSPWNGLGVVGARRSPAPYGNNGIYPSYSNGGVGSYAGVAGGGYCGVAGAPNRKWNQNGSDLQATMGGGFDGAPGTTPPQMEGGKLDNDASGFGGSNGAAVSNKQNQRGHSGQFRPYSNRFG